MASNQSSPQVVSSQSDPGYKYEFINKIPEDFLCQSCKHVAREPNLASCCGELFCKDCISSYLHDNQPCPSCGENDFVVLLNKKVKKRILSLKLYCPMNNRGCGWMGQLEQVEGHMDVQSGDCLYVDIECPSHCNQKVQKRNIQNHLSQECPLREYTCPHCNFKASYKVVSEDHWGVCPYLPVQCPNRCGVTCEREDLEDHMKICNKEELKCCFSHAGCQGRFLREDEERHMEENVEKHLSLMATAMLKISMEMEECKEVAKEQEGKFQVLFQEKLQQQDEKFQDKLQEQEAKLRKQEGKLQEQEVKFKEDLQNKEEDLQEIKNELELLQKKLHQKEREINLLQEKLPVQQELDEKDRVQVQENKSQLLQENLQDEHQEQIINLQEPDEKFTQEQEDKLQEQEDKLQGLEDKLQEQEDKLQGLEDKLERKLQEQEVKFQEDLQSKKKELEKIKKELEKKKRQAETKFQRALEEHNQDEAAKLKDIYNKVAQLQYNTGYVYRFPVTITMPLYEQLKAESRCWYSQVLYTDKCGYSFRIGVYPNGHPNSGHGTHVSVCYKPEVGNYDTQLKWPVTITVVVQLLNQHTDKDHITKTMTWTYEKKNCIGTTIWAIYKFISQEELGWNEEKETQYLKNNCLQFEVVQVNIMN